MYDYAAIVRDFEAWLLEDGRASHGTAHLTRRLAELRAEHRIDESADAAFLRRFGVHLTETFFELTPRDDATDDPLTAGDQGVAVLHNTTTATPAAMDESAATDPQQTEGPCPPTQMPHSSGSHTDRSAGRRSSATRRSASIATPTPA